MSRLSTIMLTGLVLLASARPVHPENVRDFHIRSDRDADYLPYAFDVVFDDGLIPSAAEQMPTRLRVFHPAVLRKSQGKYSRASNDANGPGGWFSDHVYPDQENYDDDGVRCDIHDWVACTDDVTQRDAIVGVGTLGDTVVVFRSFPVNDYGTEYLALYSTGLNTGTFPGRVKLLKLGDYDRDGHQEVFVFVEHSIQWRMLYCVDLVDWSIKWQFSVASGMGSGHLQFIDDRDDPRVIFTTYNPANTAEDENFRDFYSYIAVVDRDGKLRDQRKISRYPLGSRILSPDEDSNGFYLTHLADPEDPVFRQHDSLPFLLSKLDASGQILKSVPLMGLPGSPFVAPYGPTGEPAVFLRLSSDRLAVYDTLLTLLAMSDSLIAPFSYMGIIRMTGDPDPVFVCTDGIYNRDFDKILAFPIVCSSYEPIMVDSLGQVVDLVLRSWNRAIIGHIRKKSAVELAGVLYHRNQEYVLMGLSGLLVGLVVSNVFRKRAKRDLRVIDKQKSELEEAHQELKDMQAKVISSEKYRQAKDIAGGFAHEIRNALFPADGLLTSLNRKTAPTLSEPEQLRNFHMDIHRAIRRAVGVTELISQYTRLESQYSPEPVDMKSVLVEMAGANEMRIRDQGVEVSLPEISDVIAKANRKQVYIVLNNLLLNSLDALADRDGGHIAVTLAVQDDRVALGFRDNGEGIPSDQVDRVFEAFYSTKPDRGTGLGLAMSKKIVEMYSGSITVSSEPGQFTSFEITLPTHPG